MKFCCRHLFVLPVLAMVYTAAGAQTDTPAKSSTLYVGADVGPYPTMQSALTAACATHEGRRIVIPAGYTGTDDLARLKNGCTNVPIDDERTTIPSRYSWNGSFYMLNFFHNEPTSGMATVRNQMWMNYAVDDATKPSFIPGMPGNSLDNGMPVGGQYCNQIGTGYSVGNVPGGHGWSGQHCQHFQQYIFESGLHQLLAMVQTKTGKSDLNLIYGYSKDAQSAHQTASDEGTYAMTFQNGETGNYKSTVVTGGSGIIHPAGDTGASGQNRYVLDITKKLGSGHITATNMGYAILPNLTVATVDQALPQSSWIGTISADNNAAPLCDNTTFFCLPDNQVRNQHASARQYPYTVTTLAGTRGATEWVCLAGDQYAETAHIDPGMQTFSNALNYEAGQYVLFQDKVYKMTARQSLYLGDPAKPVSYSNPAATYPDPPQDPKHWAVSADDLNGKIFLSSRYPNRKVVLFAGPCTYLNVQQEQAFKGWRNAHVVMGVVNYDGLSHLIVGFYRPILEQDQVLYNYHNPYLFTLPGYDARKLSSLNRDTNGKVTATFNDDPSGIRGLLAGPAAISQAADPSFNGPITDLSFSHVPGTPHPSYTATWKQPGTFTTAAISAMAVLGATGANGYDWYPGEELERACDPSVNNGPGQSPSPPYSAELCMKAQGAAGSYMQFYDSAVTFSAGDVLEQPMFEAGDNGVRSNMFLTCGNCENSSNIRMYGPMWSGNVWNAAYNGTAEPNSSLLIFNGRNAGLYTAEEEPSNGSPFIRLFNCPNKNCATALDYALFQDDGAHVKISVSPQTHTLLMQSQGLYVESSFTAQSATVTGATTLHSLSASIRTVTSSDVARPDDYTILCNGTLTETLPFAPATGMLLNIINITSAGTCTLSGNGHQIGNANPSPTTTVPSGLNAALQFDGAIWRILSPIH